MYLSASRTRLRMAFAPYDISNANDVINKISWTVAARPVFTACSFCWRKIFRKTVRTPPHLISKPEDELRPYVRYSIISSCVRFARPSSAAHAIPFRAGPLHGASPRLSGALEAHRGTPRSVFHPGHAGCAGVAQAHLRY